ncbi:MAG: hypothetical protein H6620_12240 [Halobacteriovoraceae bacterium]|nr:hypothetical protein [Halobacteriovoraceae bacterium]
MLNSPFEAKFRTIKKTNAKLRTKLFISPIIDEVFKLLGFVYQDEAYVLPQDAFPSEIVNALQILKEFCEDVRIEALPAEEKAKRLELRVNLLNVIESF